MSKYVYWGTCLALAVIHTIMSFVTNDSDDKNHYLDRAASYTAASFIILAIPGN